MIDISKEVDVYETVYELRNIQPKLINNIVSHMNFKYFGYVHLVINVDQPNNVSSTKFFNFKNNQELFKNLYLFVKHIVNQPRSILNTGLKSMMERHFQNEYSE